MPGESITGGRNLPSFRHGWGHCHSDSPGTNRQTDWHPFADTGRATRGMRWCRDPSTILFPLPDGKVVADQPNHSPSLYAECSVRSSRPNRKMDRELASMAFLGFHGQLAPHRFDHSVHQRKTQPGT